VAWRSRAVFRVCVYDSMRFEAHYRLVIELAQSAQGESPREGVVTNGPSIGTLLPPNALYASSSVKKRS
jgi:hypothetical protein